MEIPQKPRPAKLSRAMVIFGVIAWILIGFFVWSITRGKSDTQLPIDTNASAQAQAQAQTKAQERQAMIDKYALEYCKNHTKLRLTKDAFTDNAGWPLFDGTRAWTADECATIIGKLYDTGSDEEHLQLLASGKWAIGMTLKELIYAIGIPTNANTTQFAGYEQQQLIYGNPLYGATYIYVENGVVTSFQD